VGEEKKTTVAVVPIMAQARFGRAPLAKLDGYLALGARAETIRYRAFLGYL